MSQGSDVKGAVASLLSFLHGGLLGLACAAGAIALRALLDHVVPDLVPYPLVFPAVLLATFAGGTRAGIAATIFGVVGIDYFFINPRYTLYPFNLTHALNVLVATFSLIALLFLSDRYRSAVERQSREREERLRTQQRLVAAIQERTARLRSIFDNAAVGIARVGLDGQFVEVNTRYAEIAGWSVGEMLAGGFQCITHPDDVEHNVVGMRDMLRGKASRYGAKKRYCRRDGVVVWVNLTANLVRTPRGEPDHFVVIVEDITDEKRSEVARRVAEQALRESEGKLNAIFRHSATGIALVGSDLRPVTCNPAFQRILGYSERELRGMRIYELSHPEDVEADIQLYRDLLAERDSFTAEKRYRTKGATTALCELAVSAIRGPGAEIEHYVLMITDTTERRLAETERQNLQAQLRASQQMRSLGALAGGIAHDFSNVLGAIMGFSRLLEEDLAESAPQLGFARRITDAAERGKAIVEQILSFARFGVHARAAVELGGFLNDIRPLLESLLGPHATLRLACGRLPQHALVNAGQMTQVLSNLCKNASDALEGRSGAVAVDLTRIDAAGVRRLRQAGQCDGGKMVGALSPDVEYACLQVSDDGVGIAPADLERIFDPFFTTRDGRGGTGLGLAVVHRAVETYGGACLVESVLGEGTRFSLLLPLVAGASSDGGGLATQGASLDGRIMVVDDEPDIVDALVTALRRRGFAAVGFDNPRRALETFKLDPAAWRAVITDQRMPDLRGSDLARECKSRRPELVTVMYSGFDETAASTEAHLFDLRFAKPVDLDRMILQVAALLTPDPARTERESCE